jgi:hypothetical protein
MKQTLADVAPGDAVALDVVGAADEATVAVEVAERPALTVA